MFSQQFYRSSELQYFGRMHLFALYYSLRQTPLAVPLFFSLLFLGSETWENFQKTPLPLPIKSVFCCYRFRSTLLFFRHYPDAITGLIPRGFCASDACSQFCARAIIFSFISFNLLYFDYGSFSCNVALGIENAFLLHYVDFRFLKVLK